MYRTIGAAGLALTFGSAVILTTLPARADFALGLQAYQAGDLATAKSIWQPLAEQDDPAAQRNLALIMLDPRAGKTDPKGAADWLKKAAESDFPRAHYDLAYMYFQGNGVPADSKLAAEHMQKAATLGLREAQHDMAVLFEQGVGVDKNTDMAVIWYRRAVQSGYADAVPKLSRLLAARTSRTVRSGGDFEPLDQTQNSSPDTAKNGVTTDSEPAAESAPASTEATPGASPSPSPQAGTPAKAKATGQNTELFQHLVKIFQAN